MRLTFSDFLAEADKYNWIESAVSICQVPDTECHCVYPFRSRLKQQRVQVMQSQVTSKKQSFQ